MHAHGHKTRSMEGKEAEANRSNSMGWLHAQGVGSGDVLHSVTVCQSCSPEEVVLDGAWGPASMPASKGASGLWM